MATVKLHKPERVWLVFQQHNMNCANFWQSILNFVLNRLKPGFSHVFLIKKGSAGSFIIIDPYSQVLAVYSVSIPDYIDQLKRCGMTIVETYTRDCNVKPRGLISCVSIAKYVLGIHKPGIITPWQLYNFLMKE